MIDVILMALGMSIGINLLMFIPAFKFKTDKLTDLSYSLTFIILAWLLALFNTYEFSKLILLLMITSWGLRLGVYLFIRIRKMKKDARFDKIRDKFWRFMKFWLIQGLTVWLIMMSSTIYFTTENTGFNTLSIIGLLIWAFGLIVESIADYQKFTFRNNPKNKGKFIQNGLWKYSRHPNYFGEIVNWIGIYLFALSSLDITSALIGLITPAYITITLLFISGLPPLERYYNKKYGKIFNDYKKKTSVIIPWFNKK